jgi:undecaprenyl-diphosphatase
LWRCSTSPYHSGWHSQVGQHGYQTVAATSTPLLDRPLRLVSDFADFSKPWLLVTAALALFGGTRGRRAAVTGIVAIGLSSLLVNQLIKLIGERSRPHRTQLGVPESRWVLMPDALLGRTTSTIARRWLG